MEPSSKRTRITDFSRSYRLILPFLGASGQSTLCIAQGAMFALVDRVPSFRRRLLTKLPRHQQLIKTALLRRIKEVLTKLIVQPA